MSQKLMYGFQFQITFKFLFSAKSDKQKLSHDTFHLERV